MVLKVTVPGRIRMSLWIEQKAHKFFKPKRYYSLKHYLPIEKVASLLNLTEKQTWMRAEESETFNAIQINTKIFIHPEGAWKEIVKPFREFIKKEKQRKKLTRRTPVIKRKGMNISSH